LSWACKVGGRGKIPHGMVGKRFTWLRGIKWKEEQSCRCFIKGKEKRNNLCDGKRGGEISAQQQHPEESKSFLQETTVRSGGRARKKRRRLLRGHRQLKEKSGGPEPTGPDPMNSQVKDGKKAQSERGEASRINGRTRCAHRPSRRREGTGRAINDPL